MNVTVAYNFLQISETATPEEANSAYKKLLKEYHPDTNTAQSEWAHRMTIRLKEAYSVVLSYMDNILDQSRVEFSSEKVNTGAVHRAYSAENRREVNSGYYKFNEPPVKTQDSDRYKNYSIATHMKIAEMHTILIGHIDSYYLYGMQKLYLREEGNLRQHFNIARYRLKQTIINIEEITEWPGSRKQKFQSNALQEFAQSFYQNMRIRPQNQEEYNTKAGKLYTQGSEAVDILIQQQILGKRPKNRNNNSYHCIANKSLAHIIQYYPESPISNAAVIKLSLLEATKLLAHAFQEE